MQLGTCKRMAELCHENDINVAKRERRRYVSVKRGGISHRLRIEAIKDALRRASGWWGPDETSDCSSGCNESRPNERRTYASGVKLAQR
jgi:hypothetical protein